MVDQLTENRKRLGILPGQEFLYMPSAPLRVGILGFGSRGVSLVGPILNNNLANHLTTIIDNDEPRARFYLQNCISNGAISEEDAAQIRFVTDISDITPGDLDVLFLTANEAVRAQVTPAAVRTGAHLFMEKAIAPDAARASDVVRALSETQPGQKVFMGFNLRHHPSLIQLKQVVDDGKIGKVLFVHYLETLQFLHGRGYYMRFHRDTSNSGGMLVTKSCHDFDLINHLISSRPRRVFCEQSRKFFGLGGPDAREQCSTCDRNDDCDFDRLHTMQTRKDKQRYAKVYLDKDKVSTDGYMLDLCCWRDDTQCNDLSMLMLDYESGAQATYTQLLFGPQGNRQIKLFGTHGSAEFDEISRNVIVRDRFNRHCDTITFPPDPSGHGGSDNGIIAEFFKDIRNNRTPVSTIEDGVWALATAEAAYESAAQGQWQPIAPHAQAILMQSSVNVC